MSTKQTNPKESLKFAVHKTVMSPEDRARSNNNTPRKVGLVALSALSVFAIGRNLEKKAQIQPSAISTLLPEQAYHNLTSEGLPVLSDVVIKPSQTINFRSSCNFENSDGTPADNIVFSLNPSSGNQSSNTFNLAAAIPVNGPSANPNVSPSDVWFVVPTGQGNQAVCFDASQASRGTAFSDVTINNGESAVLAKPNAAATLKDNNIYVNGRPVNQLQY